MGDGFEVMGDGFEVMSDGFEVTGSSIDIIVTSFVDCPSSKSNHRHGGQSLLLLTRSLRYVLLDVDAMSCCMATCFKPMAMMMSTQPLLATDF
jgi:hypothetical protein